ncbi:MAG TPA: SRPBCC family protein [Dokdonella sp.]
MAARNERESRRTTVRKVSDSEVVVTRTFDAPARLVFEAWTKPELFRQWWVPRSMGMTLRSCDLDVRTGGSYRLVFGDDPANTMAFFGTYLEVVPDQRIVWTNEESGDAASVTTVTFEERDGTTLLVLTERYPSKDALDEAGTGAQDAMGETFAQLDELLAELVVR